MTTRYNSSELLVGQEEGVFDTGETVTLKLYDKATRSEVPVDFNACQEIVGTGKFVWATLNITTPPTTFKQYTWTMTDSKGNQKDGSFDCLGWANNIGGGAVPPANTCKITVNLYKADGLCEVSVGELFDPNFENLIDVKNPFHSDQRYYKLGEYKPSYDQLTGKAYWIMPQGAVVNVKLDSFGVERADLTVPSQDTIDLHTWLNT